MIAIAQGMTILATLILTAISATIAKAVLMRDTDTISWVVALAVIGLMFQGWVTISQWREVRCRLRRKPVVLDLRIKGNARAGDGLSNA